MAGSPIKHRPSKVDADEGEVVQIEHREVSASGCGQFKHEPEIGAISGDPQTTTIHEPEQASTLDSVKHHERNTDHVEDTASQVSQSGIDGSDLQFDDHRGGKIEIGPDHAVCRVIEAAQGSAGKLVNLLAKHFSAFDDESRFEGRRVRFLKRAQIFVADVWAALRGAGRAAFDDVDQLTMFAGELTTQTPNCTRRSAAPRERRCCSVLPMHAYASVGGNVNHRSQMLREGFRSANKIMWQIIVSRKCCMPSG
jgi:hypothetical protein